LARGATGRVDRARRRELRLAGGAGLSGPGKRARDRPDRARARAHRGVFRSRGRQGDHRGFGAVGLLPLPSPPVSSDPIVLSRETLSPENSAKAAEMFRAAGFTVSTPEQRAASLDTTLRDWSPERDVWVFGYGSLMWNPAFEHVERRASRLGGWHRRFCLWNTFGRGSPEAPGLTLALASGGSCAGRALP